MRRTFARPRTFDLECPKCARVHVVRKPHQSTASWDHKRSRLTCRCGKVWIVGIALWDPGQHSSMKGGRPLDQIPDRKILQELIGLVAGRVKRTDTGRVAQSLARVGAAPACTCEYHREPLQYLVKAETRARCPVHGKD